ncbi:MAG: hypothetical protein IPG50_00615 [Myxococcales bacterium]|nr:hypothetical protein [Myxococcales bacterium]
MIQKTTAPTEAQALHHSKTPAATNGTLAIEKEPRPPVAALERLPFAEVLWRSPEADSTGVSLARSAASERAKPFSSKDALDEERARDTTGEPVEAAPPMSALAPSTSAQSAARPELDSAPLGELFARLVTATQLTDGARRATLRMELGTRAQGSAIVVTAEGSSVEIELSGDEGLDAARLEDKVTSALARRGIRVERFTVR